MGHSGGEATVAIVGGAGAVGSTTAFVLTDSSLVREVVLVDIDDERATGEAMDLGHGTPFASPVSVQTGTYEDCWDADIVIVSAGATQASGETRLELLERNADLFAELIPRVTDEMNGDAVLLVVTNPVDVLSHVAWSVSDLPPDRVIGSGTALDTARFQYALGQEFDIDPRDVRAPVIGEHGDSAVLVWSATDIGGIPFERYVAQYGDDDVATVRSRTEGAVRNAAYEIIERKGRTNYGVARAVAATVERILADDGSGLTVSTLASGHHGIDDEVYLSLPCTLDRGGVRDVHEFDLPPTERRGLLASAEVVRESIAQLSLK